MGLLPLEFHAHFLLGLTAQTPLLLVQSQDNNSIYGVDSAHCHKLPLILLPTDPNTSTDTQTHEAYRSPIYTTMSSAGVLVRMCAVLACLAAVPRALATAVHGDASSNGILHIPSNGSLISCPTYCGDVEISYPFGIGSGCFRQGFELTCNQTARPPMLFLRNSTTQITSIDVGSNMASASAVGFNVTMGQGVDTYNMSWGTPDGGAVISERNYGLYVVGCGLEVYMFGNNWSDLIGSCMSICADDRTMERANVFGSCNDGIGCCYIELTRDLPAFMVNLTRRNGTRAQLNDVKVLLPQHYRFVLGDLYSSWVNTSNVQDTIIQIAITDQPNCERARVNKDSYACNYESNCHDLQYGRGYSCSCPKYRQGNPYIVNGCIQGLYLVASCCFHDILNNSAYIVPELLPPF